MSQIILPCPIDGLPLEIGLAQGTPTTDREKEPGRHVHIVQDETSVACTNGHEWHAQSFIFERVR